MCVRIIPWRVFYTNGYKYNISGHMRSIKHYAADHGRKTVGVLFEALTWEKLKLKGGEFF